MAKVVLTHGFLSPNGAGTTNRLVPYLQTSHHEVIPYSYGFISFLSVRLGNAKRAEQVKILTPEGACGIAHSNGCAILRLATLLGAPFERLIFINPALDTDADIGPQVKRVEVFHNHLDLATGFANLLIKHDWGEMGRVGYRGSDPRFVNHDTGKDYEVKAFGHLGMFNKKVLEYYGPLIARLAFCPW